MRSIIAFLNSILLARFLDPDHYGRYIFLIGIFVALRQLLDLSSSSAFFTFISKRPRSSKFVKIYFSYVFIQFLLPLLVLIFFIPESLFNDIMDGENNTIVILSFVAVFAQFTVWPISTQMAESIRETFTVQVVNLIFVCIHLVAIIILWKFEILALPILFTVISLEWIIASILLFRVYFNYTKKINVLSKDDSFKSVFNEFWIYCSPFIIYAIVSFLHDFADKWLLQSWAGSTEQAFFGISQQFSSVILLATVSIIKVFWKEISEAHQKGNYELLEKLYFSSKKTLFFLSVLVSFALIPWAKEIILLFLGENYIEGYSTLFIMFFYPLHQTIGQINGTMFYATEKTKSYVYVNIIFMILGIFLLVFLIAPTSSIFFGLELGSKGVAIKLIVIQFFIVNFLSWKLSKIFSWKFSIDYQIWWIVVGLLYIYISHIIISIININVFIIEFSLCTIIFIISMVTTAYFYPKMIGFSEFSINRFFNKK